MEENILHIITTALGAMSGAYCAYLLAERKLRRSEKEKVLTSVLVLMEHMDYVSNYLDKFDIAKDGETKVNLAILSDPFYAPPITEEFIASLMELSPDKEMPRCLIHMNYFFKKLEEGTHSENAFYIPIKTFDAIRKQLQMDKKDLEFFYESECGGKKFPPLSAEKTMY
ncbi:MAG: hypothetical protein J6O04_06955 [Selenomonadaceae bacterium]|nr:hypothetical protein [Selenomonadaceae bacterium]